MDQRSVEAASMLEAYYMRLNEIEADALGRRMAFATRMLHLLGLPGDPLPAPHDSIVCRPPPDSKVPMGPVRVTARRFRSRGPRDVDPSLAQAIPASTPAMDAITRIVAAHPGRFTPTEVVRILENVIDTSRTRLNWATKRLRDDGILTWNKEGELSLAE